MTDDQKNELIRKLAFALDVALPYLSAEANRERHRPHDGALRPVTKQQRYKMAEKAVAEAFDLLGLER